MVLDTKKSYFGSEEWLRLHIWFIMTLLKNATDIITKCDRHFVTKYDKHLFQNASGFLLQNATVITIVSLQSRNIY